MGHGRGVSWPLVHALTRVPSMQELAGRNFVVRALSSELGTPLQVVESPKALEHLWSIVEVCQRRPDGLAGLLYVLDGFEPGCKQMDEVRRIVNEMTTFAVWPDEERDRLFALLAGVVIADIGEVYRLVGGLSAPELPASAGNRDYFLALDTLNADPDGLPKSLVFVEHLTGRVRPDLAAELHDWSDRQAARMELDAELQAARRKSTHPPQLHPQPRAPAYLVLQLQLEGPSGGAHRLSHWKQLDLSTGWHPERGPDVVGSIGEVRHEVAALIEDTEGEWARYNPAFQVEFVLCKELLNLDVDQWPWETETTIPEPIGCRFPVAVRPLDRMKFRKWHRLWLYRWKEFGVRRGGNGEIPEDANHWRASGGTLHDLISLFAREQALLSMVLSEPPHPNSIGAREVEIGLRAGLPLIVWHRADCADAEFVVTARELLHGMNGDDVLERARLVRANAVASGPGSDHVGRNLSVLWDDPERAITPLNVGPPEG
ncbi:effector-associated domain 2-containing protein [Saccharopolyspora shandongensis]|uniref:VMAP-C domain-containing protein n=1 Tax=Saccharopolyspora shandongensis TaxID=418495 RepID=UPI0033CEC92A